MRARTNAGFVETLDQAGLAELLFTKLPESLAERVAVAVAFGKCLQVQQDGDCRVVFARFFAADERVHVLPVGSGKKFKECCGSPRAASDRD